MCFLNHAKRCSPTEVMSISYRPALIGYIVHFFVLVIDVTSIRETYCFMIASGSLFVLKSADLMLIALSVTLSAFRVASISYLQIMVNNYFNDSTCALKFSINPDSQRIEN